MFNIRLLFLNILNSFLWNFKTIASYYQTQVLKTIFNNQKPNKMKIIKLIAISLFLVFQNGIFAQETGEIHGVIMDGDDNVPLVGATVKVYYAGN